MPPHAPEALALGFVPGTGAVDLQLLATGLVNESYRVTRDGRQYSLRIAAASTGLDAAELGLDRGWECRVLAAAAASGLGPTVVRCEPHRGLLVAEWVDGRAWTGDDVRRPRCIDAMAALLRRVHSLTPPQPPRVMSPAGWVAHYARALQRFGPEVATRSVGLYRAVQTELGRLAALPAAPPVLCHSDLHPQNVADGAQLVLLDWEYAHVSEAYWDLAGWIANNDQDEAFAAELLARYLGRAAAPAEMARLAVMVRLYDYVCLQWSELYVRERPLVPGAGVAERAERLAARLGASLR